MKSEEIVGLFERLSESIPAIAQQPTEEDVYDLYEAVYPVLLDIEYDATEGKHNLVGLVDTDADYTAQYNESFPILTRVGVYDESLLELKGDGADAKRAAGEKKHDAKLADYRTYSVTNRELRNFLTSKVDETWILELRDQRTKYTKVTPRDILDQLQTVCLGAHSIDIVALRGEMEKYHEKAASINAYINMLEAAQRKAGRIKKRGGRTRNPIHDDDLLDMAVSAQLELQQFTRANENWEQLREDEKTWAKWKAIYKAAQNIAHVRTAAAGGTNSFGGVAANAARETQQSSTDGAAAGDGTAESELGLAEMEGFFDNLAMAVKVERTTLDELVKNNSVLTATNDRLARRIATLEKEAKARPAPGGGGATNNAAKTMRCSTCNGKGSKQPPHWTKRCWEAPKNAAQRPANWVSCLS